MTVRWAVLLLALTCATGLALPAAADLADSPLAPGSRRRARLVKRPDQGRPADQISFDLFGRSMTIGGEYEFELNYERDRRLGRLPEDDELPINQRLEVEVQYNLTKDLFLYLEARGFLITVAWEQSGDTFYEFGAARGETWLYWADILKLPAQLDLSFQVGRQRTFERREWWWDEDLDAVRMHLDRPDFHFEALVGNTNLVKVSTFGDQIDPNRRRILRVLGRAHWKYVGDNHLELFVHHANDKTRRHCEFEPTFVSDPDCQRPFGLPDLLYREDEDDRDAVVTWFGAGGRGRIKFPVGRLQYYANVGYLLGREKTFDYGANVGFEARGEPPRVVDEDTDEHDVEGWGVDLTGIWLSNWDWAPGILRPPYFSLGYAYGSGDKDTDFEEYGGWRQSGLNDNNGKLGGVTRFRYYGEVFEPNLANMHIATASFGFRFLKESSIDFVYHAYAQDEKADWLFDSNLRADPRGENRFLGHAFEMIIGIREWDERARLEFLGGFFRSGAAFAGGDPTTNPPTPDQDGEMTWRVKAELDLNF